MKINNHTGSKRPDKHLSVKEASFQPTSSKNALIKKAIETLENRIFALEIKQDRNITNLDTDSSQRKTILNETKTKIEQLREAIQKLKDMN